MEILMLSRIADSLFWLNRYMERADGLLRLAYVHYILSLDKSVSYEISWKPVLEIFAPLSQEEIAELEHNGEAVLRRLLLDEKNHNSLRNIINKARENARGVQDHLTKEVWESVNSLYHAVNHPKLAERLKTDEALKVVSELIEHTVHYTGTIDITMSRGLGWYFMNLGKFLERGLQTIAFTEKQLQLISSSNQDMDDILQWRYLLLALSGYEMHLKTYRSSNHLYNTLHQIMLNENFTRSIMYSLKKINYYVSVIMEHDEDSDDLVRSFGRVYSKVRYMDLQTLNGLSLQRVLLDLRADLLDFSKRLGQHYFSYS